MGRSLIRGMLNSARGLSDKDQSPQAQTARRISGFADLDGLEFVARIDIGSDTNGEAKNEIRGAVTPDHKGYAQVMGAVGMPPHSPATAVPPAGAYAPAAGPPNSPPPPVAGAAAAPANARPSWAR
jgi:hypothetical protein